MLGRSILLLSLAMATLDAAPRIQVHGHRGARAVLPENTLPAFEYAIQTGVDVLELDMGVTKDNVVVVSHDPVLNPAICTGGTGTMVIREMTLADLKKWDCGSLKNPAYPKQKPVPGTRVPTLDEVLALAPRGKFLFNIETKISPEKPELAPSPLEFCRLVLDVVRRRKLQDRVILQSFDFRTLKEMKRMAPEIRRAALYESGIQSFAFVATRAEADIISPQYKLVTAQKVRTAHDSGFEVIPWTPNTAAEWDRLIAAGVNAIITDDPAALIEHLKAKGLR